MELENKLTYRDLRDILNAMPERNLDCQVTLLDSSGEFTPATMLESEGDDIMDDGHPYFIATDWEGSIK